MDQQLAALVSRHLTAENGQDLAPLLRQIDADPIPALGGMQYRAAA